MNKPLLILFLFQLTLGTVFAQSPIIDMWRVNNTNKIAKYYNTSGVLQNTGELANIGQLCYSSDSVWIKTTGMPEIFGPWTNPGAPTDQDFTFRFPRNPQAASSPVDVPTVFTTGVLLTGAPIFGNGDARSYKSSTNTNVNNGDGLWNGNAYYTEGFTLDSTYAGHVNQDGTYHSHATPFKLYQHLPTNVHSPIVGFAFDGYPIYGPYGYTDPNGNTSAIKRMESSYQLRSISTRTILPDGSTSTPAGPVVDGTFPLGMYIEDYEYVNGLGDLDEHNGRWCKTPEFPSGTYAYFVTIEANGDPAFPFYLGETYYGEPELDNNDPHAVINIPSSGTSCSTLGVVAPAESEFKILPNPVQGELKIEMKQSFDIADYEMTICNYLGEVLIKTQGTESIDLSSLNPGIYTLSLYSTSKGTTELQKFVKQ